MGSKYYKTVVTTTVLSKEPLGDISIQELVQENDSKLFYSETLEQDKLMTPEDSIRFLKKYDESNSFFDIREANNG